MKFNRELLKGHMKVIVLAALRDHPAHAYAMNQRLEEITLEVFSLPKGTLYPTLHKLEKVGLIASAWTTRAKGPDVRVYSLTEKGKKVLEESRREWSFFSRAMNLLLEG